MAWQRRGGRHGRPRRRDPGLCYGPVTRARFRARNEGRATTVRSGLMEVIQACLSETMHFPKGFALDAMTRAFRWSVRASAATSAVSHGACTADPLVCVTSASRPRRESHAERRRPQRLRHTTGACIRTATPQVRDPGSLPREPAFLPCKPNSSPRERCRSPREPTHLPRVTTMVMTRTKMFRSRTKALTSRTDPVRSRAHPSASLGKILAARGKRLRSPDNHGCHARQRLRLASQTSWFAR